VWSPYKIDDFETIEKVQKTTKLVISLKNSYTDYLLYLGLPTEDYLLYLGLPTEDYNDI